MYAVIVSGGKQFKVSQGDVVKLPALPEEVGADVNFDKVIAVGAEDAFKVGNPYLTNCKVAGTVVSKGRHKKIEVIKFRRRKHHEKWQGHRQDYTEVKITEIVT